MSSKTRRWRYHRSMYPFSLPQTASLSSMMTSLQLVASIAAARCPEEPKR
jgi:hypothetical protein